MESFKSEPTVVIHTLRSNLLVLRALRPFPNHRLTPILAVKRMPKPATRNETGQFDWHSLG